MNVITRLRSIVCPEADAHQHPPGLSSEHIDMVVSATLDATGSLYELDLPLLEALQPDIILTPRLPVGMTGRILADFQETHDE
jgi:hypothetical protein